MQPGLMRGPLNQNVATGTLLRQALSLTQGSFLCTLRVCDLGFGGLRHSSSCRGAALFSGPVDSPWSGPAAAYHKLAADLKPPQMSNGKKSNSAKATTALEDDHTDLVREKLQF